MPVSYQIAAVARMTGLSNDTIRAWERRYALVAPARGPNGVRLYGEGEVARLQLAGTAVGLGHPIRRVASLSDVELKSLIAASAPAAPQPGAGPGQVAAVIAAIRAYDLVRAEALLNAAALLLTPSELIIDVLAPFLREVGSAWESKKLSIAQEHFASQLVRSLLGSLMRMRPPSGEDAIIFVTPPAEFHEFGILFAAALAALHGFKPFVLGSGVPAAEVLRAARALSPVLVVIGLVRGGMDAAASGYVAEIRKKIPAAAHVWIGGASAAVMPAALVPPGVERIRNLPEFTERLARIAR